MGDPSMDRTGGVGTGTVLHTSVATLYSNLVTRPTGEAVRVAIERQIRDVRGMALSVLDFSRIGVIDFSCADEIVAKLLRRYSHSDRPGDAFFVAYGVCEHHREPIEAVLHRHRLLLVAIEKSRADLWGRAPARLRDAWHGLNEMGQARPREFAAAQGIARATATAWLRRLTAKRVAVSDGEFFSSLPAVLTGGEAPKLRLDCGPEIRDARESRQVSGAEAFRDGNRLDRDIGVEGSSHSLH